VAGVEAADNRKDLMRHLFTEYKFSKESRVDAAAAAGSHE
jgi:hypothetical protein